MRRLPASHMEVEASLRHHLARDARAAVDQCSRGPLTWCCKNIVLTSVKPLKTDKIPICSKATVVGKKLRKNTAHLLGELAQLETPIARYKPGQKAKSGNSCRFQHINHFFLGSTVFPPHAFVSATTAFWSFLLSAESMAV